VQKTSGNNFTTFKSKIGLKLTSILIILTLLPIICLGSISYINAKNIIEERFEITTEQTINEISRGLDNYFNDLKRQLKVMSFNINLQVINIKPEYEPFLMDVLKSFKENNTDISSIYVGTINKKFYAYPKLNLSSDFDPTTRLWYKEAINNRGKVIITKFFKDAVTGQPMVAIAKAVEYQGQVVGVVAMDLNMEKVTEKLSNRRV
jgi:methyl-accepting chemotaxis protein